MRKSWYLVTILFYCLTVCTLLSQKIELEMQTEVLAKKCVGSKLSNSETVTQSVLFTDGASKIYELKEGNGWNAGEMLATEYTGNWMLDLDSGMVKLEDIKNRTVILSASRFPKAGEGVRVVNDTTIGEDDYLIVYPDTIPDSGEALPGEILAQNDYAILLHIPHSVFPYMEHSAMNKLSAIQSPGWRIYSMTDVQQFQNTLPKIIFILILLVIPIFFYACSMFSASFRTGKALILQTCLAAATIFCVHILLGQIDLPVSLLPDSYIFDVMHYVETLTQIKETLNSLNVIY